LLISYKRRFLHWQEQMDGGVREKKGKQDESAIKERKTDNKKE
jgi:hypothetical protein